MKKIRVISIITTICIMALIFFFSSQTREESSEVSRNVVKKIVDAVSRLTSGSEKDKKELVDSIHNFIRTAAHFAVFALLGVSSVVMFLSNLNGMRTNAFIVAAVFCFVYACSDEIHQIFVDGRAFQLSDIIVDSFGSATGILAVILSEKIYLRLTRKGADKA